MKVWIIIKYNDKSNKKIIFNKQKLRSKMDVSVMTENIKFNYRVATIIKNGDKILLHKSKKDDFFAIPGGRIMIGEDSKTALKREFLEEMGADIFIKNTWEQ